MNVLLTGADQPLGAAVARALCLKHALRLTGRAAELAVALDNVPYTPADLRDPAQVVPLLDGTQAILHLAAYDPPEEEAHLLLDHAARGTYVLLQRAVELGIDRVVLGARLDVMADYPADYAVDETWKPLPRADARSLAPHLAELCCHEFARATAMLAISLRFGELGDAEDGVTAADAAGAIQAALKLDLVHRWPRYQWRIYHIASNGRFDTGAARRAPLNWEPAEASA